MPKRRNEELEKIGSYKLSDEPPPKRKYRPMPGVKASSEREPDEFDQPALKRFLGTDPFPWALAVCVLVWVVLGLPPAFTSRSVSCSSWPESPRAS